MTTKLRQEREKRVLTQKDLSVRTRIARGDISLLERGLRPAFPAWRKRLARALRVPERDLFPHVRDQVAR